MSSHTPDLQPPQITKSKQHKDGLNLVNVRDVEFQSLKPEMVGKRFKNMKVSSPLVYLANRQTNKEQLMCECLDCGRLELVLISMLYAPQWAGCSDCAAPQWLVRRCNAQKARCTDPLHPSYRDYGGRGIRFMFSSPRLAAQWIKKNIGIPEKISINIHLDRINNNGHYEPGNLRWSTRQENNSHTRRSKYVERFHLFRLNYPEIKYADKTLRNLMGYGLSDQQIIERFHLPSDKPKGVYGTYSTAVPEIALLAKAS